MCLSLNTLGCHTEEHTSEQQLSTVSLALNLSLEPLHTFLRTSPGAKDYDWQEYVKSFCGLNSLKDHYWTGSYVGW